MVPVVFTEKAATNVVATNVGEAGSMELPNLREKNGKRESDQLPFTW